MTVQAPDRGVLGRRGPGDAAPVAALVALAALLALLAWQMVEQPQRRWAAPAPFAVTLENTHYRVDAPRLEWLRGFSALHFAEGEEAARALAAAEIDARLDTAFAGVRARLPEFADWYYSLAGEYARLSMLALSWVELADGDYVARQASARLFPEALWQADLAALEEHTAQRLTTHHEQVRASWLAELTSRLARHQVPAPLPEAAPPESEVLQLDALVEQMLVRERDALATRVRLATVAAGSAAAGPVVWRAASRRLAANAGRPALARAAGRGAARAGSAAAGGAAVCAPGGPLALGCAMAAGAAAWLAADLALLSIDEALHREELLAALESSLAMLREDMQRDLLAAYDALIDQHYHAVQMDIQNRFVPVSAH